MIRPLTSLIAGAAFLGLSLTTAMASGPAGTVTFQGEAFVIGINDTCSSSKQAAVGDFYRIIYRYKQSSSLNDALLFVGSRSAFYVYSQTSTGSLNGPATTNNAILGSHATLSSGVPGNTNLQISAAGGASTAQALNLKIVGTVNDFYGTSGCNVTLRSDLVARPD